jgi:hypothetical protein
MPKDRPFIDASANIGRPRLSPDSELTIGAQPSSRSLRELAKFDKESRSVQAEIKNGKLRLDLSHVIGDKIVVSKETAIRFAKWILETYGTTRDTKKVSRQV